MSDCNVIPFRRKAVKPTPMELEMYRMMTRNWPDAIRQLMFPMYYEVDAKSGRQEGQ